MPAGGQRAKHGLVHSQGPEVPHREQQSHFCTYTLRYMARLALAPNQKRVESGLHPLDAPPHRGVVA